MKGYGWIAFAATRYVTAKRRDAASPSSLLAVAGIGIGVMTLIVVLAVMNGFQLGFIESILEISSYHLRIDGPALAADPASDAAGNPDAKALADLRSLAPVSAVLPFAEAQTIARGARRSQQACLARGVPRDAAVLDPGLAAKLEFQEGSFDLVAAGSILLGDELAGRLGVGLGDTVTLLSLSGSADGGLTPENAEFTVTGLFRSGFYEYDLSWAFIGLDDARALTDGRVSYGVKLRDRWRDSQAIAAIRSAGLFADREIVSWRAYNRAFFGALRMEKLLIFLLVGLIFVVVGLNVYQAQRRAVLERSDEIGLLRAVGASETAVRLVFACDGLIVGLAGAVLGLVPGLLIASRIGDFFAGLEALVNTVGAGLFAFLSFATGGRIALSGVFAVYSPAVFYIKEIPSRVIPGEIFAIVAFGIASATAAAWLASGRIARFKPAEVLRYE
jgi:lipoprotein-releasing system permease protein